MFKPKMIAIIQETFGLKIITGWYYSKFPPQNVFH